MKKTYSIQTLPKSYEELCQIYLPRTIHDNVDLKNTIEIVDILAGHKLNQDQEDYLETLSELIEAYESEHHPLPKSSGLGSLKFLLEENHLNGKDLAEILKSSHSLGYKILAGDRNLTPQQMKALGERFSVDPGLFL